MITAKLLIEEEDCQAFRIFYFAPSSVNGIYVIDNDLMGVIIQGQDYILQFDNKIFEEVKAILGLKSLGIN
jgi:hypothetical protein